MNSGGARRHQARRGEGGCILGQCPLPAELVGHECWLVHEVDGAGSG